MNRTEFLKTTLGIAGLAAMGFPSMAFGLGKKERFTVGAHVWVYAKHQSGYDVTPVLPQIFSDMKYAGLDGVETMEHPLRSEATTKIIKELIDQYQLPLIGSSYSAELWDRSKQNEIFEDVENIIRNMASVKARTFGVTVGHPSGRIKTEEEFDAQAELLIKMIAFGKKNGIVLNLHNHTQEVENNLFELKGTLKRIPDIRLGPDLDWLRRAKIDPNDFLTEYKDNIVFLHLRDQLASGKWSESIGEGVVDFKKIATTLETIGFKGDIIVELAHEDGFEPTRPIKESLKMSRESIRKSMGI